MPYISIECGHLTKEQKESLIKELTITASKSTGIPQEFFMITIKELSDESMGFGGKTVAQTKKDYKS